MLAVAAGLLFGDIVGGCAWQLCDGEPTHLEEGEYLLDSGDDGEPVEGARVQVQEEIVTIRSEGDSGAVVATYRVVDRRRRDTPYDDD